MRLLCWVAAVIVLFASADIVQADQVPPREQPVTRLTLPACKAADLKLLAMRRKFSSKPTKMLHVGKWLIAEWRRIPMNTPGLASATDPTAADSALTDNDLIEIYRAGSDPKKDCQLLVAGEPGPPNAVIEWQRKPLRDEARPEFIVGSYSGGASGCCWTNYVVSLGEALAVDRLADIYGTGGQEFSLTFNEANPIVPPDIHLLDWAFFGWQGNGTNFGAAAYYTLIWQSDRYVLEWPARAPSPSNAELLKWQKEMTGALRFTSFAKRYGATNDPSPDESYMIVQEVIWQHLVDLIYAGYTDMAVDLLNNAWPKDIPGKDLFWRDFRKQLQDVSVIWHARHLDTLLPKHLPEKG